MIRILYFIIYFIIFIQVSNAQLSKPMGSGNLIGGTVVRQYLYEINYRDSFKLALIDSQITEIARDSSEVTQINFPIGSVKVIKVVSNYSPKKKILRRADYDGNNLIRESVWGYNESIGEKISFQEFDKTNNSEKKETYENSRDKINGDLITQVTVYKNGKVEYYTREFYDKNSRKYKEVRLNDNKKDIMHTESFFYGENGKLVRRSIYFNEFKVTKDFKESENTSPIKCFKNFPLVLTERIVPANKVNFLKSFLGKNKELILDKDCSDFEYNFKVFNTELQVRSSSKNKTKQVMLSLKDKS